MICGGSVTTAKRGLVGGQRSALHPALIHGGQEQRRRRKKPLPVLLRELGRRPAQGHDQIEPLPRRWAADSRRPAPPERSSAVSAGCSETSKKLIGLARLPAQFRAQHPREQILGGGAALERVQEQHPPGCRAARRSRTRTRGSAKRSQMMLAAHAVLLPPDRQLDAHLARIAGPAADGWQRRTVRAGDVAARW